MRKSARLGAYRKRRDKEKYSAKKDGSLWRFLKIAATVFLLLFGVYLYIHFNTKYWNGRDKVGFVFQENSGDVVVTVADPALNELTTLFIPGDTEVEVAENYGILRIKNVWQLSHNEKLRGRLLPETVMRNFYFPLNLWAGSAGSALGKKDIGDVIKFIFTPSSTNIPFGDRLRLSLFALGIQSLGKNDINLGQSQFLRKENLKDGFPGYRFSGTPSERLTVYFSDNEMSQRSPKIYIIDSTGTFGVADLVGNIVEVMGGKVVSIDKRSTTEEDCKVIGGDKKLVAKVANIFSCQQSIEQNNFDLEIDLGTTFATRF